MKRILTVCILLGVLMTQCNALFADPYCVTNEDITVGSAPAITANAYQKNAYVKMFSIGGKLYYYISLWPGSFGSRSQFDGKICSIVGGEIVALLDPSEFYGADDAFMYCRLDDYIVAYDVITEETVRLLQCKNKNYYNAAQDPEGTVRLVVTGEDDAFYIIQNGAIVEETKDAPFAAQYELEGKQYYTDREKIYCQGIDISDQFGSANFRALIPYQNGLLLINDGYGNLLYYIQSDGNVQSLFPEFPCMCSASSINFYENYIFVSFSRWESYGESGFGMKAFENDTIQGTYRIDMTDHSVIKISDNIYNGMFIFDDMSIYACDREGDIHQLDFNGNIQVTIVD